MIKKTCSPLVDLNTQDISELQNLCNDSYSETKRNGVLNRNQYYTLCNKHQVDTTEFILSCSRFVGNQIATMVYNNRGVYFIYNTTDGVLDLSNLEIKKMDKNVWSHFELFLSFNFWDIQKTADKISDIAEMLEPYNKFTPTEYLPKLSPEMIPIEARFREGWEMFKKEVLNDTFADFCLSEAADLYDE